jgi:hypothetical protein
MNTTFYKLIALAAVNIAQAQIIHYSHDETQVCTRYSLTTVTISIHYFHNDDEVVGMLLHG